MKKFLSSFISIFLFSSFIGCGASVSKIRLINIEKRYSNSKDLIFISTPLILHNHKLNEVLSSVDNVGPLDNHRYLFYLFIKPGCHKLVLALNEKKVTDVIEYKSVGEKIGNNQVVIKSGYIKTGVKTEVITHTKRTFFLNFTEAGKGYSIGSIHRFLYSKGLLDDHYHKKLYSDKKQLPIAQGITISNEEEWRRTQAFPANAEMGAVNLKGFWKSALHTIMSEPKENLPEATITKDL